MKLKVLGAAVLILTLGINTSEAQQRTRVQKQRVKQGVRSGELIRAETRSVASMHRDTRRDVRRAKSDGVITRRERKEIHRDKRHTSRAIYRKKHNGRQRH